MIRIFIGSTPAQNLVVKVLMWSIEKHTKEKVAFFPLHQHQIPFEMPQNPQNRPGTPFSFQRFMIPEIVGYSGKAIYLDSDQIVFKDIAHLFNKPLKGHSLLCASPGFFRKKKQPLLPSSVMVLDCEKLDWNIKTIIHNLDNGRIKYKELFSLAHYPHKLSSRWNSADRYFRGYTALLHFTAKRKQPWINHTHQLGYLWFEYLYEALKAGYISQNEIQQDTEQQYLRPSMKYQINHNIKDPRLLPPEIKQLDQPFLQQCAVHGFNSVPGEYRSQPTSTH